MIAPARFMDNGRLEVLIHELACDIEGEDGMWRFEFEGCLIFVVGDELYNRMRVMTPIVAANELTEDDLRVVLAANFDRALDAKFAISDDYLWSLFTHPLRELTDNQFFDAVRQVKTLMSNFGSSYASSDLVYGMRSNSD